MVFCCYLLASLNPRFLNHTYIGFTNNPLRRIRQHNGEIANGAVKTHKKRPWKMVLVIHGFPTHVAALRFEWAWQHPRESRHVREVAKTCVTGLGFPWCLRAKTRMAAEMLNLPQWSKMPLGVRAVDQSIADLLGGQSALPPQMILTIGPLEDVFSGITRSDDKEYEEDDEPERESDTGLKYCCLCGECFVEDDVIAKCPVTPDCPLQAHLVCVADSILGDSSQLIPTTGPCPECGMELIWKDLLAVSAPEKSHKLFLPASQCLE